ncbi:hypothetical protein SCLCIDRAFT_18613 [Scleroderma citrinum Foug A]|uniref:Uncharacterized protein n=1 Tax=Scleroderma citrinum Foug A TaxID=1036808 RepID=A0A0C3ERP5_9AGAM|nr:hypothetical protein SCLCIDRAFT_18613 [Scleroderma citrinum Foug A]
MSIWRLMAWQLTGNGEKSGAKTTRLVNNVLLADDFKLKDLSGFNADTAIRNMDRKEASLTSDSKSLEQDGWKTDVNVDIKVPSHEKRSEGSERKFTATSKRFHLTPFKRMWKSPTTGKLQRLYDELYTSDAWNEAHDAIQKQWQEGCTLEWVIAGLMFWSDSTHLAQFGHATTWPVYLCFGNLSKYEFLAQLTTTQLALMIVVQLPESIIGFINSFTKLKNHTDLLTHCKRELFHAVWMVLLDNVFIEAYKNGIVIKCHDGVLRHVYPRIFTYSTDYPEKVLLATIRDKGLCPCPQCYLAKKSFSGLGFPMDLMGRLSGARTYPRNKIYAARCVIYQLGKPIKGTAVESILKDWSLVPTLNTFAERLSPFNFDVFSILVVDIMHEFELGVLKSVLKHLIRILYAINPSLVSTVNERYSIILPFGIDGIHCFPSNTAEMRQRVTRHFEDMLQCSIPAFEGLFPAKDDAMIKTLLFRLSEWHVLAKLWMHSDDSLAQLDQALKRLAAKIRRFKRTTCDAFKTHELPSKAAVQYRQQQAQSDGSTKPTSSAACLKPFNVLTYKFHALGDYTRSIRMFGTMDSYTTQIGELAHCQIKKFYQRMNKRDVATGLTKQERRQTRIQRQLGDHSNQEVFPDVCNTFDLASVLRENKLDPAVKNFVLKMKDHLLSQLYSYEYDGDECLFTDDERNDLRIIGGLNWVIESTIFRVNYTTYDVCREQDVMRPGPGCFVMTLSREDGHDGHPFWYAQVIRVFHIEVLHVGPNAQCRSPQSMELLWVHWLGVEPRYHWGFREAWLPKVGFVPESDYNAFGFLDPSLVIHGCHLIPAFSDSHTTVLLRQGASIARHPTEDDDWSSYYVNIFADRDMFCRFAVIGVGHSIQYPIQATSYNNSKSNEDDEVDQEDDCASIRACSVVRDTVPDEASGWNSDEDSEDSETSEAEHRDNEGDGFDLEDDGDMSDGDVRF